MLFFNRPIADSIEKPEPASVRRFLIELYGRDELELLCADYFRDVYVETEGTAMTKSALAQKLIDHCRRNGQLEQLWAALQKTRPEAFSQQFSQYSRQALPEPQRRVRDPHRIFISYAHPDRQVARRLAADLHAHGFGVWFAPDSIHPGESWVSAIDRGLQECGVFVAVLSPGALKSQWVKSETRVAIQLEHAGKLRLIPVLAKPCDPTKLSSFLASYQGVPLSRSYERGFENVLMELGGAPEPEPEEETVAEATPPAINTRLPDTEPVHVPASARFSLSEPLRMELIRIPAGSFWMGSHLKRDPHANANERPRHRVRLSEYFIAKYPVTNEQYAVFAKATQRNFKLPVGKASHPVVNVSWDDAQAFCAWLSAETGRRFMLPSEAEWEKAARGTDGRIYPWGDTFDASRLNSCEAGPRDTQPVGHFSPRGDSPYGIADLCGNTWEWCDDWFADEAYAQRARSKVVDPLGPPQGTVRALRGGAFDFDRLAVRCAYREGAPPYERSYDYGFRVVMRP